MDFTTTTTGTLADALLDDLDDLSAVADEEEDQYDDDDDDDDDDNDDEDEDDADEMDHPNKEVMDHTANANNDDEHNVHTNIKTITTTTTMKRKNQQQQQQQRQYENLVDDPKFIRHIQSIEQMLLIKDVKEEEEGSTPTVDTTAANNRTLNDPTTSSTTTTTKTNDENEYLNRLLLQTNYYLTMIQQEIDRYYYCILDIYQYKFPQLEEIITNHIQYINVVTVLEQQYHNSVQELQLPVPSSSLPSAVPNHNNNSINNNNNTTKNHDTIVFDQLHPYVSPQQIITLSVAYSTSNGRVLSDNERQMLHTYIHMIQDYLVPYQKVCIDYIEQQMISIVPNMVTLLNSSQLVAQLLSYTNGSLDQLIKIPACNIQLLGQIKHSSKERGGTVLRLPFLRNNANTTNNNNNSSSTSSILQQQQQQPHTGILVQCDLVQSVPLALQRKVLKMVASKLVLCIRCDYDYYIKHGRNTPTSSTTDNTTASKTPGYIFRQQIQTKIQQLLEPDKAPVLKALPKPDLTVKKRRGGQRMRRLKGRYEETALMKQANTRAFSIQTGEYGDDAMGRTLGLLEMSTGSVGGGTTMNEHGTIRSKNHIEVKKMKYANTRASRKKMAQMNRYGGTTHVSSTTTAANTIAAAASGSKSNNYNSGLVSSVVFTPSQGMELVNPDAQKDRIKEANRKWFQENAGFQSALPKK